MGKKTPVTVAYGDGIGPEIMEASLHIIQESGAQLELETIEIGEKVYLRGNTAGIDPESWESLRRTKVFYKAPITTPQGGGFKSLNVTARKRLGLYANIRPCVAYAPYVDTKHPGMNVHIVRENEEDLYAGIEYQLSSDVMECLKLISRPGTEKIVRFVGITASMFEDSGAARERKEWTPNPARKFEKIELVGVDLYMGSKGKAPKEFGDGLSQITHEGLKLTMVDNRGIIVWPGGMAETFTVDNYRCRFENGGQTVTQNQIAALYQKVIAAGFDIVKTETLRTFDGQKGFTLAQRQ